MPRGRKPKTTVDVIPVKVDHAKLLKEFEEEQKVQLETFYKDLAFIKEKINFSLRNVGQIDECESIGEAAFKAGRVYGPLDQVNDKLEVMLEVIYGSNDFDHWEDISCENC